VKKRFTEQQTDQLWQQVIFSKNEIITTENCSMLRAEQNRRPGVFPEKFAKINGRKAAVNIAAGEGIRLKNVK
jgi:sialic acid synthase SpsE